MLTAGRTSFFFPTNSLTGSNAELGRRSHALASACDLFEAQMIVKAAPNIAKRTVPFILVSCSESFYVLP
jgi:hypothetical protein